jgi:hypothetical protein
VTILPRHNHSSIYPFCFYVYVFVLVVAIIPEGDHSNTYPLRVAQ